MRVTGELEPISAADVGVATYVQVSRKSQDPTGKIQGKGEWQKWSQVFIFTHGLGSSKNVICIFGEYERKLENPLEHAKNMHTAKGIQTMNFRTTPPFFHFNVNIKETEQHEVWESLSLKE